MRYWFDGQWFDQETLTLPITEPGLLFGATVFTTLRVYGQDLHHSLTQWTAHGDRLRQSVAHFRWSSPDWRALTQAAEELAQTYPVLRLTLFPGGQAWILGRFLPSDLGDRQQQGITAVLMASGLYQRSLAPWKTGNYFAPWWAQHQAQRQQGQEAILTNGAGHWLETSTGNLWGWRHGEFYTPLISGEQLPGIAQHFLIRQLTHQGIPVHQHPWTPDGIDQLQGLAYSNSVVAIVPITQVLTDPDPLAFPLAPQSAEYSLLLQYFQP